MMAMPGDAHIAVLSQTLCSCSRPCTRRLCEQVVSHVETTLSCHQYNQGQQLGRVAGNLVCVCGAAEVIKAQSQ